jgi:mono/diheme cytochrome c family protein
MRHPLRWAAYAVGGLLVILVLAAATLYTVGGAKLNRTYTVEPAALTIPTDSVALARGAHVLATNGCRDCHGHDLSGQVIEDAPPFRVVASNLTSGRGGIGGQYSDVDWDRSIRHGVRPDGRPVFIMPSAAYHRLSDADAAALIAYLKTVPPVDHELPATEVRALGRMMAAGLIDPAFEVRTAPARTAGPPYGPTAEYGEYLASVTCQYCHGEDLRGAQPPNPASPVAPDLIPTGEWQLDTFREVLRTGQRPDGTEINPAFMPIALTQNYSDHEIAALWSYIRSISDPSAAPSR